MVQYLLSAILDLIIGSAALKRRMGKASAALFFMTLCSAMWSLELYVLTVIADEELLSTWFHVLRVGMFFIPSSLALVACCLIGGSSAIFLRWIVVPSFAASALLSVSNLFLYPSSLRPAEQGFLPEVDGIYLGFSALFTATLAASIIYGVIRFRYSTQRDKQRIKWLSITLVVALATGVVSLIMAAQDFYLSKLVGISGKTIFIALLFYSTVYHHLVDLRLALSEGGARLCLVGFFTWLYFVVVAELASSFDATGSTLTLMLYFVAVLESYPTLLAKMLDRTKSALSVGRYDLQNTLRETRAELSQCVDHSGLTSVLNQLICQTIGLERYEIYENSAGVDCPLGLGLKPGSSNFVYIDEVDDKSRVRLQGSATALLTLRQEGGSICALLLGRARFSRGYEYHDILLLEKLVPDIARAIKRVEKLKNLENELHDSKKRLSMVTLMSHYYHDIKAPLSVIDGVLTNQLYDSETQRQVILEQVELGSKLITTVADILKEKRARNVGPVSLGKVLDESLLVFKNALAHVGIQVDDKIAIAGDPDDLKIMFINVIKNAVEAAGPGKMVAINIGMWRNGDRINVNVTDDGEGIDSERLHRLWDEPFTTKAQGNGIGLQAIKRIADEHQATIDVRSEPGKGTEFVFSFPAATQAIPVEEIA
jgi:signal transduction histidine kinase